MPRTYDKPARDQIIKDLTGKKIERVYYEDGDKVSGPYWVVELEGGGEISLRFMAELV